MFSQGYHMKDIFKKKGIVCHVLLESLREVYVANKINTENLFCMLVTPDVFRFCLARRGDKIHLKVGIHTRLNKVLRVLRRDRIKKIIFGTPTDSYHHVRASQVARDCFCAHLLIGNLVTNW